MLLIGRDAVDALQTTQPGCWLGRRVQWQKKQMSISAYVISAENFLEKTVNDVFRVLLIADVHYSRSDSQKHPRRQYTLGRELLRRAVEDARRRSPAGSGEKKFDCIALLGDVVDNETADAPALLAEMAAELAKAAPDTPVLVTPGNHDVPGLQAALGQTSLTREFTSASGAKYRFVIFADSYGPGDLCTRDEADRDRLRREAKGDDATLIALQHNPMNPPIEDEYPYMLTNRREIMDDYAAAGVAISISGHYHAGQAETQVGGVKYLTVPALCEAPYQYALLTLRRRATEVTIHRLAMPSEPGIIDCHAHTEFAYCGRGISARNVLHRAGLMNLAGVCLVEHAPQLYCRADDFWVGRHVREPDVWRKAEHSRMAEFRRQVAPLRGPAVRVGLEVEVDREGQITIHDEDRQWLDLLVGAIHWLPKEPKGMTEAQIIDCFLDTSGILLRGGISVLAHPLRFFSWFKRPTPKEVYPILADMIAEARVAAEINYHLNEPDAEFFAMCVQRGVKISFGSDTHELFEAGAMNPHLDLLRQVADGRNLCDVLWQLPPLK